MGTVDWTDIDYFSISITEVAAASDFNLFIDDLVITPSDNPINNWGNGTLFCIDSDNVRTGCLDINTSSAATLVTNSADGDFNKFWIWADLNLTGFTPFDIFDFDFNWGIGVIPLAN